MHSRLEQYVEQVEARLTQLPPAQRESETEEMRQHISAMVEARMASGLCEEKAITDTLEQFGQAQTVSRQLTRTHGRNHKFLPDNLLTAMVSAALCSWGGALLLFLSLCLVELNGLNLRFTDVYSRSVQMTYVVSVILAGCVVTGAITGGLFPRRAIVGIGATFLIWCCIGLNNISRLFSPPLESVLFVCGFWTVTAAFTMLGAKAGAMWRRRRLYRRRLAA